MPLEVLFQIPKYIENGLVSGSFERVGGVIRESASKQVVAWLREGGAKTIGNTLSLGPAAPFAAILNAANAATKLYDGHLTRSAMGALQRQVQATTSLIRFTSAGQLLTLSLTAASLRTITKRIDKLSEDIDSLGELIREQFKRDRDTAFKVALEAASDAAAADNPDFRNNAVDRALNGLREARENFDKDFKETLGGDLRVAQHYLIRTMYAQISLIRCYLDAEEVNLAKDRLQESMPDFEEKVCRLVKLWLGEHPALFFHKGVDSQTLDRFIQIQQWLRDPTQSNNHQPTADALTTMFDIIDTLRVDFWNANITKNKYGRNPIKRVRNQPIRSLEDRLASFPDRLARAEAIIENYQRLRGFELEMRSVRLSADQSFRQWREKIDEEALAEHNLGIIINTDILQELGY